MSWEIVSGARSAQPSDGAAIALQTAISFQDGKKKILDIRHDGTVVLHVPTDIASRRFYASISTMLRDRFYRRAELLSIARTSNHDFREALLRAERDLRECASTLLSNPSSPSNDVLIKSTLLRTADTLNTLSKAV